MAELTRRPDRSGDVLREPAPEAALMVQRRGDLVLVRSPHDVTLTAADIEDLEIALRSETRMTTVIADDLAVGDAAFWPQLTAVLDDLCEGGVRAVRLAVTGAGQDRPDGPAPAARIARAWGIAVEAPDGTPVLVPGGSLFVPSAPGQLRGWRRFFPDATLESHGPRLPAPVWQQALADIPLGPGGRCTARHIPAGLLVWQGEGTPSPESLELVSAIPVDPRCPTVVVGRPGAEEMSATALAELLSAIPAPWRTRLRLAPGGQRDLLPVGQSLADCSGQEVEVSTGLPLMMSGDRDAGGYGGRSVLTGPNGEPTWLPFVDAVLCRPGAGQGPELLRITHPLQGEGNPVSGEPPRRALGGGWQVAVTRAGLWLGTDVGEDGPSTPVAVRVDGPVIEIGAPGESLSASLPDALGRLLGLLAEEVRERTTLQIQGLLQDGGRAVAELAARFRVGAALQGADGAGSVPAAPSVVSEAVIPHLDPPSARRRDPGPAPAPDVDGAWPHLLRGSTRRSADAVRRARPGGLDGASSWAELDAAWPHIAQARRMDSVPGRRPDGQSGPKSRSAPFSRAPGEPSQQTVPRGRRAVPPRPSTESFPVPPELLEVRDWARGGQGRWSRPIQDLELPPFPLPELPEPPEPPPPVPDVPDVQGVQGVQGAGQERQARPYRDVEPPSPVPSGPRQHSGPSTSTPEQRQRQSPPVHPDQPVHESVGPQPQPTAPSPHPSALPVDQDETSPAGRLTTLHRYLADDDGSPNGGALTRLLRSGQDGARPLGARLASELRQLPTHRGLVVRVADARAVGLAPGDVLRDDAPVSGLAVRSGGGRPVGPSFAIWSVTGRRIGELLGADAAADEVVFAPRTPFRVVAIRPGGEVLLRELPGVGPASLKAMARGTGRELDEADRMALTRLDEALRTNTAGSTSDGRWPDRCSGAIGAGP